MIIDIMNRVAESIRDAGLPCHEWQIWVDDEELVHYYWNPGRELDDDEDARFTVIIGRQFYMPDHVLVESLN